MVHTAHDLFVLASAVLEFTASFSLLTYTLVVGYGTMKDYA
jgi:hypothetical protein